MTNVERDHMQNALNAALRWSYLDTATHVASGVPKDRNYDPAYIADVNCIRSALKLLSNKPSNNVT